MTGELVCIRCGKPSTPEDPVVFSPEPTNPNILVHQRWCAPVYVPGESNRVHLNETMVARANIAFRSKLFEKYVSEAEWMRIVEAARVFSKTVTDVEQDLLMRRYQARMDPSDPSGGGNPAAEIDLSNDLMPGPRGGEFEHGANKP